MGNPNRQVFNPYTNGVDHGEGNDPRVSRRGFMSMMVGGVAAAGLTACGGETPQTAATVSPEASPESTPSATPTAEQTTTKPTPSVETSPTPTVAETTAAPTETSTAPERLHPPVVEYAECMEHVDSTTPEETSEMMRNGEEGKVGWNQWMMNLDAVGVGLGGLADGYPAGAVEDFLLKSSGSLSGPELATVTDIHVVSALSMRQDGGVTDFSDLGKLPLDKKRAEERWRVVYAVSDAGNLDMPSSEFGKQILTTQNDTNNFLLNILPFNDTVIEVGHGWDIERAELLGNVSYTTTYGKIFELSFVNIPPKPNRTELTDTTRVIAHLPIETSEIPRTVPYGSGVDPRVMEKVEWTVNNRGTYTMINKETKEPITVAKQVGLAGHKDHALNILNNLKTKAAQ